MGRYDTRQIHVTGENDESKDVISNITGGTVWKSAFVCYSDLSDFLV